MVEAYHIAAIVGVIAIAILRFHFSGLLNPLFGKSDEIRSIFTPTKLPKYDVHNLGYCWGSRTTKPSLLDLAPHQVWGSYMPDLYFGMRTISTSQMIQTGILWSSEHVKDKYRHKTSQDELENFEWTYHDGIRYGEEIMVDNNGGVLLNASFLVGQTNTPAWIQTISVDNLKSHQDENQQSSLLFYFGIENDEVLRNEDSGVSFRRVVPSENEATMVETIIGYSKLSGYFKLQFYVLSRLDDSAFMIPPSDIIQLQFIECTTIAEGINNFQEDVLRRARHGSTITTNRDSRNANFLGIEIQTELNSYSLVSIYNDRIEARSMDELESALLSDLNSLSVPSHSWDKISSLILERKDDFNVKFDDIYKLDMEVSDTREIYTPADVVIAKRALSSLLGGIGYFYGKPRIGEGNEIGSDGNFIDSAELVRIKEDINQKRLHNRILQERETLSLFTATPSRTSFPRGFLWDEGFHQLVVLEWDFDLTMRTMLSWLDNLHYYSPDRVLKHRVHMEKAQFNLGGWIPREMILGEEATKRVPDEFVTQRVNIANPPTLFLVIEKLLSKFETITESCEANMSKRERDACQLMYNDDKSKFYKFFQQIYPKLNDWLRWYLISQRGPKPGSFRWRGRTMTDQKLVANTLASGLDDYPRSPIPNNEEYHLDLFSWITKSAIIMSRVQQTLNITTLESYLEFVKKNNPIGEASKEVDDISEEERVQKTQESWLDYNSLSSQLLSKLDSLHWSDDNYAYMDVGLYDLENTGILNEVIARCQNPSNKDNVDVSVAVAFNNHPLEVKSYCPEDYPKLLYQHRNDDGTPKTRDRLYYKKESMSLQFIPHLGYSNLYPFLLTLVSPHSGQLSILLGMIENPDLFWSDYGIRSLSASDLFYWKDNAPGDRPYWRGPIWINMNYLALRALDYYRFLDGPEQNRCTRMYTELRKNILAMILGEYKRTGQFWEQYDDRTGQGMRGHPFTGWTSLLVNIMAEMY